MNVLVKFSRSNYPNCVIDCNFIRAIDVGKVKQEGKEKPSIEVITEQAKHVFSFADHRLRAMAFRGLEVVWMLNKGVECGEWSKVEDMARDVYDIAECKGVLIDLSVLGEDPQFTKQAGIKAIEW